MIQLLVLSIIIIIIIIIIIVLSIISIILRILLGKQRFLLENLLQTSSDVQFQHLAHLLINLDFFGRVPEDHASQLE
ncbi:hypothetical protein M436DRAFT_56718 [Aureobasidium namibiae CBS 147.97]|uniref:Uncharacterized protein n=1 Tax=Aureobasidium namibiae CBS 147.97 TaxID=1043004 RepID=A0A074WC63_9PEZI|nr:uncharacterized protein M436DRAFT_56718 [Aureobasidium namibiae CBS 147.97]KEQ69129.1 hypothetical protein M436DRAFT_56718 [Aureobasidium namibiae CBS 147.97]